mgnify:CR=1 FL=1
MNAFIEMGFLRKEVQALRLHKDGDNVIMFDTDSEHVIVRFVPVLRVIIKDAQF